MLSQESYQLAMACYLGAAGLALLYLAWLLRRLSIGWIALFVLLGAALLLTPAYPQEGVDTLAPALIVAGFQTLTEGPEAAMHAWRPLAIFSALAVVSAVAIGLIGRRYRQNRRKAVVQAAQEAE